MDVLCTFIQWIIIKPCSEGETCVHAYIWKCSWPLDNMGISGTNGPHNQKSAYNLWLPQNLTINNLLLTGSLMDNIHNQWTHILYVL